MCAGSCASHHGSKERMVTGDDRPGLVQSVTGFPASLDLVADKDAGVKRG